jgi:hypothetical protein
MVMIVFVVASQILQQLLPTMVMIIITSSSSHHYHLIIITFSYFLPTKSNAQKRTLHRETAIRQRRSSV